MPSVLSGVHLIGEGRRASVLKVDGMPTNHLLQCEGDNWSVENLTFDMGDYTPLGRLFGHFLPGQQLASEKLCDHQKRQMGDRGIWWQQLVYRRKLH